MTIDKNSSAFSPTASEYILDNFEPTDQIAMLALNRSLGEVLQRVTSAKKASSPKFQAWLRYKNATGSDIYIGMNPLRKHASTRKKEDIQSIRHVYLDLDHGGQEALNSVENSRTVPKPNYVLTSSPGKFQIVWKVEGMGLREAEGLLHAMARECGGDPAATDATRVLRLPGFANKKYETNFLVEVRKESSQIYRLRDFKLNIESQDSPCYSDHERAKRAGSSRANVSQSEHDWAFARRALARGEPLEQIIRRIAQYRAGFKSNPLYYARYTVMKVAKLFRQNSSTEHKKDGYRDSKEELPSEH